MIVALAILAATRASPVVSASSPLVSLEPFRGPSCNDHHGCRSLRDIIWSCAVTILLCIWVSVHPNIPSPDEKWPRVTVRRIGLMLAALFAPEIMIGWALRQRQTAAIGHFAIMGGFMEYEGNRPVRVLLPGQLESYSLTGNGDFPRIAKEEIEDKSKGDIISKALVILQTGWFVTQCIARGVQGLPITELELVTVAFAALNFVMYILWWDKPLNVRRGVRVYKKRSTEDAMDDGEVEATSSVGFWGALRDSLSKLPAAIVRGPFTSDTDRKDIPWVWRVLLWPFLKPLAILGGEYLANVNLKRVNTFYPDRWPKGRSRRAFIIVTGIASAFGGIHCIGWSFIFLSSPERTIWRVASISITVAPIVLLIVQIIRGDINPELPFPWAIILATQLPIYLLSRLALLVLPFLALRSLPPATYQVVHWTSFIPHV